MPEAVNVVFGHLAEDVLRSALINAGRSEHVIVFPDDLSCGPLSTFGAQREIWMQENLFLSPNEWGIFPSNLVPFLTALDPVRSKIVFWICKNCTYELCGFARSVSHIAGNLYYIDTMAAAQLEHGRPDEGFPPRLAHISPEIVTHLIGTEVPLSTSRRKEQLESWTQLRAANAPLRTIGPQGIQSVSLSYFDPLLLAFADVKWQSAQWVVTQAAVAANDDNFFCVDMMTLTGRLRALVKQGQLVADKEITDREMSVRLP
jgi:hypothetical protein